MSSESRDHKSGDSELGAADSYARAVWREFESRFPTEESAVEELHSRLLALSERLETCGSCGCRDTFREQGSRKIDCLRCGRSKWFTAGTFFHGVKRPRAWLATLWLMERGVVLNSFRLHKLLGIAYSSALNMFKKITMVVNASMEPHSMLVPSGAFSPTFCKRSRETPAREHPLSEESVIGRGERYEFTNTGTPLQRNHDPQPSEPGPPDLGDVGNQIARIDDGCVEEVNDSSTLVNTDFHCEGMESLPKLLESGPVNFDDLCELASMTPARLASSLTILELTGVIRSIPGNRFVLAKLARNPQPGFAESAPMGVASQAIIDQVIAFVEDAFHGISRKYLQNYLAAYWCFIDRARWCAGALLDSCMRFGHVPNHEIVAYVSPPMVMLPSMQPNG